jgi:hypothetical protein
MVPLPHHTLDFQFSSRALADQIVQSALTRDPVRLERAITAALEIHGGAEPAERSVFGPARRAAGAIGRECSMAVDQAIDACVNARRVAGA